MKGPKRRKKKDNPYTILHDMDKYKFYVLFNSNGVINKVEVVAISIIIIFSINVFAYKSELFDVFQLLKKILKKKK